MEVEIRRDCSGVDWNVVPEILASAGIAHFIDSVFKKESGFSE